MYIYILKHTIAVDGTAPLIYMSLKNSCPLYLVFSMYIYILKTRYTFRPFTHFLVFIGLMMGLALNKKVCYNKYIYKLKRRH